MKQRGFTLIEVLIAFAMLVLFSAAFYEAAGAALALHSKGQRISRAALVADSIMSQVNVGETLRIGASHSGSTDGCAWGMSAAQRSQPMPAHEAPEALLLPVTVIVEVTCSETSHADDVVVERVFLMQRAGA